MEDAEEDEAAPVVADRFTAPGSALKHPRFIVILNMTSIPKSYAHVTSNVILRSDEPTVEKLSSITPIMIDNTM